MIGTFSYRIIPNTFPLHEILDGLCHMPTDSIPQLFLLIEPGRGSIVTSNWPGGNLISSSLLLPWTSPKIEKKNAN